MDLTKELQAKSFTEMESDNFHLPTLHLHKPAIFLDDVLSIIADTERAVGLKNMVSLPSRTQWIKVSEKKPKYNIDVLCYDSDRGRIIIASLKMGYTDLDKWFRDGFGNYGNQRGITKWMPLPEA